MSKIICCDTGEPYSMEGLCAIEVLFAFDERPLTPEESRYYRKIVAELDAARARVDAMSDEELLRL
jgi:hypothetical protein